DLAFNVEDLWPEPGPLLVEGERVAVEIRLRMAGNVTLVADVFTLAGGRIRRLAIYTGPAATGRPRRSGEQLPGRAVLVDTRLAGHAEHALADHVALHLLGAAPDPRAPLHEELLLPVPIGHRVVVGEHRGRTLEREHEVAVGLELARYRELQHRRLGP